MYFTLEDYKKIQQYLSQHTVKDTQFPDTQVMTANDLLPIVQDGENKIIKVSDANKIIYNLLMPEIKEDMGELYPTDIYNVTTQQQLPRITLQEAIDAVPSKDRKTGLLITFTNPDGKWELYQYQGETIDNFDDTDYWQDIGGQLIDPSIEDQPLVSPQLEGTWSYGDVTSTDKDIVAERGYIVTWDGSFKWQKQDSYKLPKRCDGDFGEVLPQSNVDSDSITRQFTSDGSISQNLYAPKVGLIVVGEKVVNAYGEDKTTVKGTVTFKDRLFYGVVTAVPNAEQIKNLASELVSTRQKTLTNITTNKGEYFVYAYPASLGNLTRIIQNGATPVLGAFNKYNVTYTGNAGNSILLNVYVSANDGAFTNVQLQFI